MTLPMTATMMKPVNTTGMVRVTKSRLCRYAKIRHNA